MMDHEFEIGRFNELRVVKELHHGVYLDGGEAFGEILLPAKASPKGLKNGDKVNVFLYYDSEDRVIATTIQPHGMAGDFAAMRVVEVNEVGAFLDWGIPGKDLLVPFREQNRALEPGQLVVVYVYLDTHQGRIVASTRIDKFLDQTPPRYKPWQEVALLIARPTELGYMAVIDNAHSGLLYANEVFEKLQEGDLRTGYIKNIRPDGKIDLTLRKRGYEEAKSLTSAVLEALEKNGGFLPLTDKSAPEDIYDRFGVSKKAFKQAVGALYKKRLIRLDSDGIRTGSESKGTGRKK